MKYSHVQSGDEQGRQTDDGAVSVASSKRRFGRKRINSELSEPLTANRSSIVDEELGDSGDPYFVFRSDLHQKLEMVDESLAEYLRIVHETDTAVNVYEYKDTKKKLKRDLKNAESTLKDVHTTVQVVENDREKFPYIDDAQLFERKSLVSTSKERLIKAKEEMHSEAVKLKMLEDERNKAVRRSGDGTLGARTDAERQNTSFLMDNQAQSSVLMQQQDEVLDELGDAVTRVGEMAGNISEEIGQQNKMLDELDEDLTNVEEELGMVMGKLAKFLKTKDRWQLRTILALTLTAIVLLLLVIYS
mmetsp:Transcript_131778/g.196354  ORF Transcript_131778/g.196354 Transcript_131778/m.196354 type:complete len:303 (-) Transcript_131778:42-950(-)